MDTEQKRVVVIAVDNSEFAEKAFEFYCENAMRDGDFLCLVHVPEIYDLTMASPAVADRLLKDVKGRVHDLESKYKEKLLQKKLVGKIRTGQGRPGEVICNFAQEEDAAMIVVGCRGLGKIRRTFLGSVSDFVLHHAHVPVVVVRH